MRNKTVQIARELRKKQTPQEIILWSRLKNRQFKGLKFRRQYPIGGYVVDFLCLDKKLIIELDGWQHKLKDNKDYDKERSDILNDLGYRVLRFWNNEINNNLEGVFFEIEKFL